jgi:hypothetical protein
MVLQLLHAQFGEPSVDCFEVPAGKFFGEFPRKSLLVQPAYRLSRIGAALHHLGAQPPILSKIDNP